MDASRIAGNGRPGRSRSGAHCIFTFHPTASAEDAIGVWKIYYQKWECVTRQRLAAGLLDLIPDLGRYAPPAAIIDRTGYSAFNGGRLQDFCTGTTQIRS